MVINPNKISIDFKDTPYAKESGASVQLSLIHIWAKAQEEDLCRKSSLLCSLESEEAAPYYIYNREKQSYLAVSYTHLAKDRAVTPFAQPPISSNFLILTFPMSFQILESVSYTHLVFSGC